MDVFEAIAEGLHDHELTQLADAIRDRQKRVPLVKDDVVIVDVVGQPKYMYGVRGTVENAKTGKKNHGDDVVLIKPLEEDTYKLAGTKMMYYSQGEYKVKSINVPRGMLSKVTQ